MNLSEAATIKSRARRMIRDMGELLADKNLPQGLRSQIEGLRTSLRKTWKELENEATQDSGRKSIASQEDGMADMKIPAENAEAEKVAEHGYDETSVPYGVTSFTQLNAVKAAEEVAHEISELTQQYQGLLSNIIWSPTEVPEKIDMIRTLTDEFIVMLESTTMASDETNMSASNEVSESENTEVEQLAENASDFTLFEADNTREPLRLDLQIIKPGWGNKNDNHYYPAEMLQRDAHVFEGAKMYATDHRQEEKSVLTEVSVIEKIVGFTEQGAPIGRVVIFDPVFAEQVRTRASAGQLGTLECSILADGKARAGYERDGRKGKIVEAIVSASSVDWVTKAGAGGKVLNLVENATGSGAPVEEPAKPETEPVSETAAEPVTISETDPAPAPEPTPEPMFLAVGEVGEILSKTSLPAKSVVALMTATYESTEVLEGAIAAEVQRVKEISGSGKPFALGESARNQPPAIRSIAEIEQTMDQVNKKFNIGR